MTDDPDLLINPDNCFNIICSVTHLPTHSIIDDFNDCFITTSASLKSLV